MTIGVSGWLGLDAPPRVVYERTPLALALCQIRFASVLSVSNPVAVAPFQDDIRDDYPLTIQEQGVKIRLEGDVQIQRAAVQSNIESVTWKFSDLTDTWTVLLTSDSIGLETREYRDFADFSRRLHRILKALLKHFRPTVGTRIGLRYINEIRVDGEEWASLIRPELLGWLGLEQLTGKVTQSIQQVGLKGPDDSRINLQHGLIPQGTTVVPRAEAPQPQGAFYLLDFDVYQEFKPGVLDMKLGPLLQRIEEFHVVISELFRWSVTEPYAATLGRRDDAVD